MCSRTVSQLFTLVQVFTCNLVTWLRLTRRFHPKTVLVTSVPTFGDTLNVCDCSTELGCEELWRQCKDLQRICGCSKELKCDGSYGYSTRTDRDCLWLLNIAGQWSQSSRYSTGTDRGCLWLLQRAELWLQSYEDSARTDTDCDCSTELDCEGSARKEQIKRK